MTRPLRLLQLVHGYPPAVGGTEYEIRDICERLVSRHGVDVTVFATNAYTNANFLDSSLPTVPIVPDEVQNGVKIRRFPVVTRWAKPLRVLQRGFYQLGLPGNDRLRTWYQGPISPAMRRATAEFDADVICAACFPLNHMTYPFLRPDSRPVVLFAAVHTDDDWGFRRPNLIGLVARSYATVCFTLSERDWLVGQGAPADHIRILGLGTDPDALRPRPVFRSQHGIPDDALLVAYVGQQGGHKGIETLIEVFPDLLERFPAARMVVAGAPTPYSRQLRAMEAALPSHVRERVLMLDFLDPQEKVDLLAACDVFASPSGYESFGLTTLEAWARSKPVVVGDGPAQRSIVNAGVTGMLVPYRDRDRLLDALSKLAADPGLRRAMGEAGRRVVLERYTLDRVADDFHALYCQAAGRQ